MSRAFLARYRTAVTFAGIAALGHPLAAHAATLESSDIYDEQVYESNSVNKAVGNVSLSDFITMVNDAYDNGGGGVVHFDDQEDGATLADADRNNEPGTIPEDEGFDTEYGATSSQNMRITMGPATGRPDNEDKGIHDGSWLVQSGSDDWDRTPISGNQTRSNALSGLTDWDFQFSTGLQAVGITALSRSDGARDLSLTLSYDDGSSENVASNVRLAGGNGTDDTFFGYQAPEGKRITNLALNVDDAGTSNPAYTSVDDLAFVVNSDLYPISASELAPAEYENLAIAYAQAMVDQGRDTYGDVESPLFAAQMTRPGYHVPEDPHQTFPEMDAYGLRYDDRAWGSANAQDHVQLYKQLYAMSEDTGENRYAEAADAAIQYTFQNLRSDNTDLLAWGEEISWMLHFDKARLPGTGILDGQYDSQYNDLHEPSDRWSPELWDKSFELAPEGAKAFVRGLWNHQIDDQETGDFSRHAQYSSHGPNTEASFPRVGAWMMLAWAKAHQHVENDQEFDQTMVDAVNTIANSYQDRRDATTNALPAGTGSTYGTVFWMTNNLTMAAEIGEILAMNTLPAETLALLENLASQSDEIILNKLDHNLDGHLTDQSIGFHQRAHTDQLENGKLKIGDPRGKKDNDFTDFWTAGYGSPMTSSAALLMFERYEQLGDTQYGSDYFELAMDAADLYVAEAIDDGIALHPLALAEAIQLMLKAYELDGGEEYLSRAQFFGDTAYSLFYDDSSALPKVTSQHDFYEALTGGDDLSMALYDLGQTIPEPKSMLLLGLGITVTIARRRNRSSVPLR